MIEDEDMKTSVVIEARYLPRQYQDTAIRLAFQPPANPQRPDAHMYEWLGSMKFHHTFSVKDVETVERICAILRGEKVIPRQRHGLLARLFGMR
jgi:hypothetical protein